MGSLIEKPDYSIHVDGTEADKKEYRSRIGLNSYIAYTSIKNLKKLNAYTKKCNAMFDYHGRFRYFYNIFMDLVILVSLIYSAFAIGFISKENISDVNLGIDITVLVLFSIEIIINFLTIYYDDQGS